MPKQITVIIDAKGGTTVETRGFAGQECEKETAALESALGGRTANKRTGEFFSTQQTTNKATR